MKIKSILSILAITVAAAGFSSCNQGDDGDNAEYYLDLMTVSATTDAGTVFTLRKNADSPLITLTTNQVISGDYVRQGYRVLVNYTADEQYKSGAISVQSTAPAIGYGLAIPQATSADFGDWNGEGVNVYDIWRTGMYLNVSLMASSTPSYKKCGIVLDSATMNSEYPEAHLYFVSNQSGEVSIYAYYLSYSLEDLFNNTSCKGLRLYYNDSTQPNGNILIENPYYSKPR